MVQDRASFRTTKGKHEGASNKLPGSNLKCQVLEATFISRQLLRLPQGHWERQLPHIRHALPVTAAPSKRGMRIIDERHAVPDEHHVPTISENSAHNRTCECCRPLSGKQFSHQSCEN
jgi:hypothetical protein